MPEVTRQQPFRISMSEDGRRNCDAGGRRTLIGIRLLQCGSGVSKTALIVVIMGGAMYNVSPLLVTARYGGTIQIQIQIQMGICRARLTNCPGALTNVRMLCETGEL